MKQAVVELIERGQVNQLKRFWLQTPNCHPIRTKGKPLSLYKLSSLFGFVIFGSLLALGLSLMEKCFEKCLKKSKQSSSFFIMKKKMVLKNLEKSLKECGESLQHESTSENQELLYLMDELLSKYETLAPELLLIILKFIYHIKLHKKL